jgi:KaiC/GvpD/RAD55 family RecA-like ATPase
MSGVVRYDPGLSGNKASMFKFQGGDYVQYADYKALEERLKSVEAVAELRRTSLESVVAKANEITARLDKARQALVWIRDKSPDYAACLKKASHVLDNAKNPK